MEIPLVVERGVKPQLIGSRIERDPLLYAFPFNPILHNAHMQTRMARKLPNGNYLVPHLLAFAVKEYKPNGTVVRTIKTDLTELGGRKQRNWPFTAIHLKGGNLLVNLNQWK